MLDPNQPSINFGRLQTCSENIANAQGRAARYGKLPDSAQDVGLCVYRPLSTAQIIRAAVANADRNTQRAVDELVTTVFEIPKIFPLKTLLDAYSSRNNLSVPNEPDMVV
jgi:hypothetical protein